MTKIQSTDTLRAVRQENLRKIRLREKGQGLSRQVILRVAMGKCGIEAGAREISRALARKIDEEGLPAVILLTDCMGYCYAEPMIEVTVPGEPPCIHGNLTPESAVELLAGDELRAAFTRLTGLEAIP